jgi:hypothetical protein
LNSQLNQETKMNTQQQQSTLELNQQWLSRNKVVIGAWWQATEMPANAKEIVSHGGITIYKASNGFAYAIRGTRVIGMCLCPWVGWQRPNRTGKSNVHSMLDALRAKR